jgi:hypothetical protein
MSRSLSRRTRRLDGFTVAVLRMTRVRLSALFPSSKVNVAQSLARLTSTRSFHRSFPFTLLLLPPTAIPTPIATGPILGWLNVVQAHKESGVELPVNLRFCFEGMEESGSEGLEELVVETAKEEWKDVDAVCISDNYWFVLTPSPSPLFFPSPPSCLLPSAAH